MRYHTSPEIRATPTTPPTTPPAMAAVFVSLVLMGVEMGGDEGVVMGGDGGSVIGDVEGVVIGGDGGRASTMACEVRVGAWIMDAVPLMPKSHLSFEFRALELIFMAIFAMIRVSTVMVVLISTTLALDNSRL